MTVYSIDSKSTDTTYDYTGLTSGHKRPPLVERLYTEMIDAWAAYMAATDEDPLDHERLFVLHRAAKRADHAYSDAYNLWQLSYGACTCTPRHMCRVCVARAKLADDDMPF